MKLYITIIRRNTRRRKSKHFTISLGKKEEKGSVVVNKTNIEAAFIVKARKILRDEVERLWITRAHRWPLKREPSRTLNRSEIAILKLPSGKSIFNPFTAKLAAPSLGK